MIVVVTAEIATRALIGDVSAFTAILKVQHKREAEQNARGNLLKEEKTRAEAAAEKEEHSVADEIIRGKDD